MTDYLEKQPLVAHISLITSQEHFDDFFDTEALYPYLSSGEELTQMEDFS